MAKTTRAWKLLTGIAPGLGKPEQGKPCEDATRAKVSRERVVMAVGDGAGHANYTHAALASAIATDVVIRFALEFCAAMVPATCRDAHNAALRVVTAVRTALRATAIASGVDMRVFATTLSFCYVTKEAALIANIGDSPVVVEHIDGRLELVTRPREDSQAANVTHFVSEDDFQLHLRTVLIREPIRSIAIFSDGLEIAALKEGRTPHADFFNPLFDWAAIANRREKQQLIHDFLQREDVQRLSGDDMSIAIATQRGASDV